MHPGFPSGQPRTSPEPSVVAIIPARYGSTRFPGKVLADLAGRPVVEHVYRRALAARTVSRVLVATDDERVRTAVERFGGEARLTSPDHASGTDRLAEVAASLEAALVVNVQGDEPLIEPEAIDQAVAAIVDDPALAISTLSCPIGSDAEAADPNVVKVVVDRLGHALYFSRSRIPFDRDGTGGAPARKHIGLYVYRREFLLAFARLAPTPLERAERLEQLRALEHGYRIRVVETRFDSVGVDTPEDLERARAFLSPHHADHSASDQVHLRDGRRRLVAR